MIVSHSNLKTLNDCDYKFYFGVKLNLAPKEWPDPIQRGFVGHEFMEQAFNYILQGANYDEVVEQLNIYLEEFITTKPHFMRFTDVYRQVLAFVNYFFQQPWKVVATEVNSNWPIDENATFGFTPDLILEWTAGVKKGTPFVLDYKFTAQFWNDNQINLVQQMLKYLIYYNKIHGTKMRHAGVVMLNTRANRSDNSNLFLLKWLPVSKTKLAQIERENEILVKRAEPYFRMTPEEFKAQAVRTPNEFHCKGCFFAEICNLDLNGLDTKNAIKSKFIVNDYGYN